MVNTPHPTVPDVSFDSTSNSFVCNLCVAAGHKAIRSKNGTISGQWAQGTSSTRIVKHMKKHPGWESSNNEAATLSQSTRSQTNVTTIDDDDDDDIGSPVPVPATPMRAQVQQSLKLPGMTTAQQRAQKTFNSLINKFAAASHIPHNAFAKEEFEDLFKFVYGTSVRTLVVPSRKTLRAELVEDSNEIKKQIREELKGKYVLLLVDGGTINHKRLINVSLSHEGESYFYESFPVSDTTSAAISKLLNQIREDLAKDEVNVVGMVSDNASNMILASEIIQAMSDEDAENDEIEDDFMRELLKDPIDLGDGRYFVHIRCWAHTFQLVLNDAFRVPSLAALWKTASDVITCFSNSAKNAQLLKEMTKNTGDSGNFDGFSIIKGCATRWSSKVAAMYRLYEIGQETLSHFVKNLPENFCDQLLLAVALLFHICSATNDVQGDDVTLIKAIPILANVKSQYDSLAAKTWKSHTVFAKEIVQAICESLEQRIDQNFTNVAVSHIKLLTPPFNFSDSKVKIQLASEVQPLFPGSDVLNELNQIQADWNKFAKDEEQRKKACMSNKEIFTTVNYTFESFWQSKKGAYAIFPLYADIIKSMALTEAHVERIFSIQSSVHSKSRNRMGIETTNAFLTLNDAANRAKKKLRPEKLFKPECVTRNLFPAKLYMRVIQQFAEDKPREVLEAELITRGCRTRSTIKAAVAKLQVPAFGTKVRIIYRGQPVNGVILSHPHEATMKVHLEHNELIEISPTENFTVIA